MSLERITSRKNPLLQHVKKLQASRAYRTSCGEFVSDGTKLLEEAVKWNAKLHTVIAADDIPLCALPEETRVVRVPADVMQSVSQMETPQGVLFVCGLPMNPLLAFPRGGLILEGIQDPGNLGTILRTADALDVPVVLTEGCADPYSTKAVRASMGAVFRTPPQRTGRDAVISYCRQNLIPLYATALTEKAVDLRSVALSDAAVVIGSEGRGISEVFLQQTERQIIIPMSPRCESLNAAVAAAIVLWQMRR